MILPTLIGPSNDSFAIFASPDGRGMYSVVIFPNAPESQQDIVIPAHQIRDFAASRQTHTEILPVAAGNDLFIHSLTAEDVQELTDAAARNLLHRKQRTLPA
jgi:hypothetical protein